MRYKELSVKLTRRLNLLVRRAKVFNLLVSLFCRNFGELLEDRWRHPDQYYKLLTIAHDLKTNICLRQNPRELSKVLELHNFEWDGERLVQVETQPHHIMGVLGSIRETLAMSDCEWDDILSSYYECEEDETITFYESEVVDMGNPGIWTYVVYECEEGQETVVTDADINIIDPALELQKLLAVA